MPEFLFYPLGSVEGSCSAFRTILFPQPLLVCLGLRTTKAALKPPVLICFGEMETLPAPQTNAASNVLVPPQTC